MLSALQHVQSASMLSLICCRRTDPGQPGVCPRLSCWPLDLVWRCGVFESRWSARNQLSGSALQPPLLAV